MMPIRSLACYREAVVAMVSVYDRKTRRSGTVYLGGFPSRARRSYRRLTALIEAVFRARTEPPPPFVYITDKRNRQAGYYSRVLRLMGDSHRLGRALEWR